MGLVIYHGDNKKYVQLDKKNEEKIDLIQIPIEKDSKPKKYKKDKKELTKENKKFLNLLKTSKVPLNAIQSKD